MDVRHESTAAFAAEGWAKVTREPGVAAVSAGPGVTNGMGALASAQQNHTPMLVLGGRAPQARWGQGSLQEIDHVPFVRPLVKMAATARSDRRDTRPGGRRPRMRASSRTAAPRSSTSRWTSSFTQAEAPANPDPVPGRPSPAPADPTQVDRAVALLRRTPSAP